MPTNEEFFLFHKRVNLKSQEHQTQAPEVPNVEHRLAQLSAIIKIGSRDQIELQIK